MKRGPVDPEKDNIATLLAAVAVGFFLAAAYVFLYWIFHKVPPPTP